MNKIPILITVALILVATVAATYLHRSDALSLTDSELLNAHIAIAASLGAFVSATFVVFSYLQTNRAYVESQRPHLLVQIENLKANEDNSSARLVPMTRIHYRNITTNRFTDLSLVVYIVKGKSTFNLSDLFREKMTMIGLDSRQRTFNTFTELRGRGLELQEVTSSGSVVQLIIDYEYTFNGKRDYVSAQMYRWDAARQEWSIC